MTRTTYILMVIIFMNFNFMSLAQDNANLTGLQYSLKKLESIAGQNNLKEDVTNLNKYILKANNYLEKLKNEGNGLSNSEWAKYKAKINQYENIYNNLLDAENKIQEKTQSNSSVETAYELEMKEKIKQQQEEMLEMYEQQQSIIFKKEPDNGIQGTIHKENIGKIQFGNYTYGNSNSNFVDSVSLETVFNYYVFLEQSIHNMAVDEAKKTNDRRWLAASENSLQFIIYANGKETMRWLEVTPREQETNTFYTDEVMCEFPKSFYGAGGFYRYYGEKTVLNNLKPGTHSIKVEAYLYNYTVAESHKIKIAEGSFTLSFTEADKIKLEKERNVQPQRRDYNNMCNHEIYLRTSPTGVKNSYKSGSGGTSSYSKGQSIWVFNPISNQTKFLMKLESENQPIIITREYCSY